MDIKDIVQLPELAGLRATTTPAAKPAASESASFGELLGDSLAEVNRLQNQASQSVEALAKGEKVSLHQTLIAMEQADVSFRLMMQVRNKIVEAYQEILRMQV